MAESATSDSIGLNSTFQDSMFQGSTVRPAMSSARAGLRSSSRNAQRVRASVRVPIAASVAQDAEAAAAEATVELTGPPAAVTFETASEMASVETAAVAGRAASRVGRSADLACRHLARSEARWGGRQVVARQAAACAMVQAAGADQLADSPDRLTDGVDQLAASVARGG